MIDPIRGTLIIVFAAIAIACVICAVRGVRQRRRSAWNRRFADARFSPRQEEVAQRYAEYEEPTYLRTRAEEEQLLPGILRRQAN